MTISIIRRDTYEILCNQSNERTNECEEKAYNRLSNTWDYLTGVSVRGFIHLENSSQQTQ